MAKLVYPDFKTVTINSSVVQLVILGKLSLSSFQYYVCILRGLYTFLANKRTQNGQFSRDWSSLNISKDIQRYLKIFKDI